MTHRHKFFSKQPGRTGCGNSVEQSCAEDEVDAFFLNLKVRKENQRKKEGYKLGNRENRLVLPKLKFQEDK